MSNTTEEILISKNTFERYKEVICPECNITYTVDGTVKCINFERCMTNKCKTCDKEKECFKK